MCSFNRSILVGCVSPCRIYPISGFFEEILHLWFVKQTHPLGPYIRTYLYRWDYIGQGNALTTEQVLPLRFLCPHVACQWSGRWQELMRFLRWYPHSQLFVHCWRMTSQRMRSQWIACRLLGTMRIAQYNIMPLVDLVFHCDGLFLCLCLLCSDTGWMCIEDGGHRFEGRYPFYGLPCFV